MGSKYRWFDFAGSNPKHGNLPSLDELLAQEKPAASSKSQGPTSGEIRRSNEAAVGGKRDKCQKGKSCSATCIYYNDDCLVGLDPGVSSNVTSVRNMLRNLEEKGVLDDEQISSYFGRIIQSKKSGGDEDDEEESGGFDPSSSALKKRGKEINEAAEQLKKVHTVNGALNQKAYEKDLEHTLELAVSASFTEREKAIPPSVSEIEGTQRRISQLQAYTKLQAEAQAASDAGKPLTPQQLSEKLAPLAKERRTQGEPSEAKVSLFLSLLPDTERKYLEKAGALDKSPVGGKFGKDTSTTALPESYGPLSKQTGDQKNARARVLAAVFLAEDGRDFASGIRMPITWMDMEHNIPADVAGKAAEQGLNYSFFRTGSNVGRGSTPYDTWWATRVRDGGYQFDNNSSLSAESRKKVQETFDMKMSQIRFKNDVESRASRAKTADQLRTLAKEANAVEDKALREKLLTKILAFNLNASAETVGGGIQSHGRGDKRWYWFGKDVAGSGALSSQLVEKMAQLYERGDKDALAKAREILNSGTTRVKAQVQSRVQPAKEDIDVDTGLPFVRVKGERGAQVRAIVEEVRNDVFNELMAL
jgi:hypothetical protein